MLAYITISRVRRIKLLHSNHMLALEHNKIFPHVATYDMISQKLYCLQPYYNFLYLLKKITALELNPVNCGLPRTAFVKWPQIWNNVLVPWIWLEFSHYDSLWKLRLVYIIFKAPAMNSNNYNHIVRPTFR